MNKSGQSHSSDSQEPNAPNEILIPSPLVAQINFSKAHIAQSRVREGEIQYLLIFEEPEGTDALWLRAGQIPPHLIETFSEIQIKGVTLKYLRDFTQMFTIVSHCVRNHTLMYEVDLGGSVRQFFDSNLVKSLDANKVLTYLEGCLLIFDQDAKTICPTINRSGAPDPGIVLITHISNLLQAYAHLTLPPLVVDAWLDSTGAEELQASILKKLFADSQIPVQNQFYSDSIYVNLNPAQVTQVQHIAKVLESVSGLGNPAVDLWFPLFSIYQVNGTGMFTPLIINAPPSKPLLFT